MKIRNGFVSNSSSSSFVIRGVRMKKEELLKLFNITEGNLNVQDFDSRETAISEALMSYGCFNQQDLSIEDTKFYFDGEPTDDMIVGISICRLEDGEVTELPEVNDNEIKEKIEKQLKTKIGKLSTFVQFVGNDNY